MATKQIAASTLWQLASQVIMAALSILTVKFVAIGLTKELAGNYNSAYGFLQLFGILADFGLYAVAVREVSKAKRREDVLGALIIIRSIILFISLAAALIFVWFLPMWKGTPLPLSVTIAALVPFFSLLAGMLRTIFQVYYKMHYVFIAEVVQRIITVSLIGMFIAMGVRGSNDLQILHMFLFIGGIGSFVLFLISLTLGNKLIKIRLSFDRALLMDLTRKAAPFGIAFLCMALYRQFDITLIALLRPDFELQNAYYGFVLRMADMGFIIPTFLLNSTLPQLSENDQKGEDTRSMLGRTFLIVLILGSISFLFSVLWSRPLIQLMTTDAYLSTAARPGSDTALRLLGIPMFLNGFVIYAFYVLLNRHKWRRLVICLMSAAVLSIIANIIVIPSYGFVGAACVSIGIHILLTLVLFPQSLKVMPMHIERRHWMQWLTFSFCLAAFLWMMAPVLTNEITTAIGLVAATVLMGALIYGTKLHKTIIS